MQPQNQNFQPFDPVSQPSPEQFPSPDANATNNSFEKPKSKKKKVILISLGVVLLLIAAAVAAFVFVYNKPDSVVADSLMKVMSAKSGEGVATLVVTTEGSPTVSATYNFKQAEDRQGTGSFGIGVEDNGKKYDLNLSYAVDKQKTVYVKAEKIADLVKSFEDKNPGLSEYTSQYQSLISAIDNKWISISQSDLEELLGKPSTNKEVECFESKFAEFQNSKSQQSEIRKAYNDNKFILVESVGMETINGTMSNHYKLKFDDKKSQSFEKAVVGTTLFKNIDNCTDEDLAKSVNESDSSSADTENDSKTKVDVDYWVGVFSHSPTKFKLNVSSEDSTTTFEILPKLNSKPSVTMPKADKSILELKTEIEKIYSPSSI